MRAGLRARQMVNLALMVPACLLAAGLSWALTGDFGARNVLERRAGLADGGYTSKPLRWAARRPIGSVAEAS